MTYTFTKEDLASILPNNKKIDEWHDAMCAILPKYEINSKVRVAAFIAQCSHESGQFTILHENLNYKAERLLQVFPKYFPTLAIAKKYERKPELIASKIYGNRMGNGNEASCEGFKYCGRGVIQLTGKANYSSFAASVGLELGELCEYICTTEGALESACWFWKTHKLNQLADKGDTLGITKAINGGTNGLAERKSNYQLALKFLP